jgi:serine/threonine protein phosphatase 1
MPRYAISDIHGCLKTFRKALRTVNFDKTDTLILLGDYVDRGIDSAGVISEIIKLQKEGYKIVPLMGNHERMMLDALNMPFGETLSLWLYNGGNACLNSYGFNNSGYVKQTINSVVPEKHLEFISNLGLIFNEWDDYVFCHAMLDFSTSDPINNSSEDCLIWSRTYYIDNTKINNRTLITGHTPTIKSKMLKMLEDAYKKHIIIDRGCVFPQSDYNHLAIMNLDTKWINFIPNIDQINRD